MVIGGLFVVGALGLEIGSAFRMGPGYFPLVLAAVLIALGLRSLIGSFGAASRPHHAYTLARPRPDPPPAPHFRAYRPRSRASAEHCPRGADLELCEPPSVRAAGPVSDRRADHLLRARLW